jgi:hypothetical protein
LTFRVIYATFSLVDKTISVIWQADTANSGYVPGHITRLARQKGKSQELADAEALESGI